MGEQADKITAILKAANVTVEPFWPTLFAKMLKTKNINDLITNVGGGAAVAAAPAATSAPAAEEKKETKKEVAKEESDEELGLSLFD